MVLFFKSCSYCFMNKTIVVKTMKCFILYNLLAKITRSYLKLVTLETIKTQNCLSIISAG